MNTAYNKLETAILNAGGALANFTATVARCGGYSDAVSVRATVNDTDCTVYPLSNNRVAIAAFGKAPVYQVLTAADVDAVIVGATAPEADE